MTRSRIIRLTALAAVITLQHMGVQAQTAQARWTIAEIPTLGGTSNFAITANNSGQVTGYAKMEACGHYVLRYRQGPTEDLQAALPSDNGTGNAINVSGAIAGTSSSLDAFAGIAASGWTLEVANGINDLEQIVVTGHGTPPIDLTNIATGTLQLGTGRSLLLTGSGEISHACNGGSL